MGTKRPTGTVKSTENAVLGLKIPSRYPWVFSYTRGSTRGVVGLLVGPGKMFPFLRGGRDDRERVATSYYSL